MKICGIIAEYNPFHEGHAYHLREARRLSGADAVIVVMSGHFVQRGEPAITDPYERAGAALRNGADAVFMMPPAASTSSAEGFAAYGVKMLDALGCDCISCGVEPVQDHGSAAATGIAGAQNSYSGTDGTMKLRQIAAKLADEDEAIGAKIRAALKRGISYPAALAEAAGITGAGPNTILAIEYLKAMRRLHSSMEFVPVDRAGSGYNDIEALAGAYPSAMALRRIILAGGSFADAGCTGSQDGQKYCLMPDYPIGPDDVMPMVVESIRNHIGELEAFEDCSPAIASRIRNSRLHYNTYEEMVTDIKTKDVTYTRISRVLMHILLNIRRNYGQKSAGDVSDKSAGAMYAQLIGFRDRGVLTEINKRSLQRSADGFRIISKAADGKDILAEAAYAAEIYNQALWNKYHAEGKDFFRQKILIC